MLRRLLPCLALLAFLLPPSPSEASMPDTTRLVVMGTADLHGWVVPWDYYTDEPRQDVGMTKIATLADSVRNVHAHTLLLDAGDWLQGNSMAEYFAVVDTNRTYPLLTAADAIGYDALVLGNHEFDFGIEMLNRRIVQAETPILGANIYHHGTEESAYLPYIMREVDDIRVAIIGLKTPGSAVWNRHHVEGRLDFAGGVEVARRYVDEVRRKGAELVIILAHSGLEGTTSYQLEGLGEENFGRSIAEEVPGVDLLVLGHTHRVLLDEVDGPDGRSVPVIQGGRWADHLALAELSIVRGESGAVHVAEHELRAHSVEGVRQHEEVFALVEEAHEDVRAYVNEALATTDEAWETDEARRQPTAAIDLIHHVQRQVTGAELSAAAAFTTSLTLGPGAITRGEITQLYPYENTLYKLEITGSQIHEFLEYTSQYYQEAEGEVFPETSPGWPGYNYDMIAGVNYTLDLRHPVGERVVELTYEGELVGDDDRFTIAINSYRAGGGGGFDMLEDAPVIEHYERSVREMIIDHLREAGTIDPEQVPRSAWQLLPEPTAVR